MIRARVVMIVEGQGTTIWEGEYSERGERTFQQLLLDVASTIQKPLRWGQASGLYLFFNLES